MKGQQIYPENCTNQTCPFWDKQAEEMCNSLEPQNNKWIETYCNKQRRTNDNSSIIKAYREIGEKGRRTSKRD